MADAEWPFRFFLALYGQRKAHFSLSVLLLLIASFLLLIASNSYATGNGIQHQEEGYNRKIGPELGEQIVTGGYSYTAPDGKLYSIQYKADAGGFQPIGDHLPTPPPLPQELQQ